MFHYNGGNLKTYAKIVRALDGAVGQVLASQVSPQVIITMDWLPTLLAAAGTGLDPAYPSDGEDILPVLLGARTPYPRTLYWRYKAQSQRAVRDGD
ncbi:MAG TPA: hypothetical protein VLK82_01010 [Candidatus Tectomicrobia bacterium]|nr:hypothetical protein [Candidatus Tectomicrobia bacterium]